MKIKRVFLASDHAGFLLKQTISKFLINKGIKILDLLSTNKIMSSKNEARRAIKSNALKINNEILTEENKLIQLNDFNNEKILKISFGKKKHYILKII